MSETKTGLCPWLRTFAKLLAVFICLTFVLTAFAVSVNSPIPSKKSWYLVWTDTPEKKEQLRASGLEISEEYESMLLLKCTAQEKLIVEKGGYPILPTNDRTLLIAGTYEFDTEKGEPALPSEWKVNSGSYYIVQFVGPAKSEWLNKLNSLGAKILNSAYKYGVIAEMVTSVKAEVSKLSFVNWVGINQPAYKVLAPSLFQKTTDARVMLKVFVYEEKQLTGLKQKLEMMGCCVSEVSFGAKYLVAELPGNKVSLVAGIPEVEWVMEWSEPQLMVYKTGTSPQPMNIHAGVVGRAHEVWYAEDNGLQIGGLGLNITGKNMVIGVSDTGFDKGSASSGHYDFFRGPLTDRVIYVSGADSSGHGTHVSGIAVGNGWCWAKHFNPGLGQSDPFDYRRALAGAAPEGVLAFTAGLSSGGWNTMYSSYNAKIFTNSWGGGSMNQYDPTVDNWQRTRPDALVFFSAWNNGPKPGTTGPPSTNWNGVSVGANENLWPAQGAADPTRVVGFSSRGPGWIGNVKPDIGSVGYMVLSTRSSNVAQAPDAEMVMDHYPDTPDGRSDYTWMSGTSMSCPRAAGETLLIRQYLVDYIGISNPNNVLMKACLINGAVDMGYGYGTNPSDHSAIAFEQGWGMVDVKNVICPNPPRRNQFQEGTISSSGVQWYPNLINTDIQSGKVPLKVTLVFTNSPVANPSHNLNLIVTSPSGVKYHGNQFTNSWSTPNPPLTDFDSINNVEQVLVNNPEPGLWNVTVDSVAATGLSKLAVVFSGDVEPTQVHRIGLTTERVRTESFHYNRAINIDDTISNVTKPGQSVNVTFNVLNYGTTNGENIAISDNSSTMPGFTVTYTPGPSLVLNSGKDQNVTAHISIASTVSNGTYKMRIKAVASNDPANPKAQDRIDVTLYVQDPSLNLPPEERLTDHFWSQTDPSVCAFNLSGTVHVFVSYANETSDGPQVEILHSADGGVTFSPPYKITSTREYPSDIRLTWMPGGTKIGRMFASWNGNDPGGGGPWAQVAYSDPPYNTWTISGAAAVNVNFGSGSNNEKRMVFTLARPNGEVLLVFEHLDHSGGNLQSVNTAVSISADNGETWGNCYDITPTDRNYYFFPNGCVDQKGNAWVFYYWRTPTGFTNRDLCARMYDGTWGNKINILDAQAGGPFANNMFPAGVSSSEGVNNNRVYCAFTTGESSEGHRSIYVVYTDDDGITWNGVSGSPGYQIPTIGPFGLNVSRTGYTSRPILDMDTAVSGQNKTVWITYLEGGASAPSYNPWGLIASPDVHIAYTMNGFQTYGTYIVTQDGYSKMSQMSSVVGNMTYTVYCSSSNYGNIDVWMKKYSTYFPPPPQDYYERTAFTQGWMLLSIPISPFDKTIGNVLKDLAGHYDKVRWYDSSDANDHWKVYEVNKPSYMNDLLNIYNIIGFWINITDPTNAKINVTGAYPWGTTYVILKPGWNLVGLPSRTPFDISLLPSGFIIKEFNATNQYRLKTMTSGTMNPDNGYWIFNSQTTDYLWQVPP